MAKETSIIHLKESHEANPFGSLFLEGWGEISAPIRPSERECNLYEEYLKKIAVL